MRGRPITKTEISKIISLRKTGHSLPEICKIVKRGGSTVYKYCKDVDVLAEYKDTLREKRGGSKIRAEKKWVQATKDAKGLLGKIEQRDKLFILAALYWGEGTKSELDIINGDPLLIKTYVSCLHEIGIKKNDLRISLRTYEDINIYKAKEFWATVCGVNTSEILKVNILKGKKYGKLPFGMCRVRVTRSEESFKLIISMIGFIKSEISKLS